MEEMEHESTEQSGGNIILHISGGGSYVATSYMVMPKKSITSNSARISPSAYLLQINGDEDDI